VSRYASIRHILWDWNGTLLDDVDLCLFALNELCRKRRLPLVSREEYRAKFTFPVIEYYKSVGFDFEKEPFEGPAQEWVALYTGNVRQRARLYDGATEALTLLHERGYRQSILSAHQHDMLVETVGYFGLAGFFAPILGLGDYYAHSKLELGEAWLRESGHDPRHVLMIGDTLHDHEVARAMGAPCLLLAQGHQLRARLERAGAPVLSSIDEVPGYLDRRP